MRNRSTLLSLALLIGVASIASAHFVYRHFSPPRGLILVGEATTADGALRICPATPYSKGAVWFEQRQRVDQGFVTYFTFRFTEQASLGGDGFAFVVQDQSRDALGSVYGGALGYSDWPECGPGGIRSSLAVEFDLWRNGELDDPDNNHISVHTGKTGPNCADQRYSIGWTSAIPDLHTESAHTVTLHYEPGLLSIFLDDLSAPVLTVPVDLVATLGLVDGRAFVGFTAGTGQEVQNHDILDWVFLEGAP